MDSGYYEASELELIATGRAALRRPAGSVPVHPTAPARDEEARMSEHILEMRWITKTFPGVKALQDVNLAVARGEIHAICGENGAGKSTLMKVLSGVYPHGTYEGEIVFEGETVALPGHQATASAAGSSSSTRSWRWSPFLSVAENIFLGNERATRGFINWNETNAEAADLLRRVGLDENPSVTRRWTSASASSSSSRSPRRSPRT